MKIDIDQIKIDETTRIRQDIGELSELQESINEVGLINPILIDEQNRLIAGFRRLSACKNLGWKEIEVHVAELEDDELKMLEAEAAENMFRKDFTPDEILAIQKRREEIAEARRPKGIFERFWIWLKSLFAAEPEPEPEVKSEAVAAPPAQAAPVEAVDQAESTTTAEDNSEPDEPVEQDEPAAQSEPAKQDEPAEPDEQSEPDEQQVKPEPPSDSNKSTGGAVPKQPKSAEIVEENGVRHIKWR